MDRNFDTWEGIRRAGPPNRVDPTDFSTPPPKIVRLTSGGFYIDRRPAVKRERSVSLGHEDDWEDDELTQICAAADEEQEEFEKRKKDKKEIYCVCVEGWCVKIFEDLNTELTHTVERVNVIDLTK